MNDQGNWRTRVDAPDKKWLANGVIVHDRVVHMVAINYWLLVMDVRHWALSQAEAHERDAETATTDAAHVLMGKIALNLRLWAQNDPEIVNSSTALRESSLPIYQRAEIGYLKVSEENIDAYLQAVLGRAMPAKLGIPPNFLFLTGPGQPQLFATHEVSHLKRFAETWVRGKVVSKSGLRLRLDTVAEQYPDKVRKETKSSHPPVNRFEPDDPLFRKRRQILLALAKIVDIPLGMSDIFATDLDKLQARLAAHPEWPAPLFEEVLQVAFAVSSRRSVGSLARRRSEGKNGGDFGVL